jgi:hypothetical protein
MPLKPGKKNFNKNYQELATMPILSPARHKAILTLAKKHNISFQQAKQYQAQRISETLAKKK